MTPEHRPGVQHERPRSSRSASLYRALLDSLELPDRQWVLEVVARERKAELDGDRSGELHPRAMS